MNISVPKIFFPKDYLDSLVSKYASQYKNAKPFSHIVIDNFLPQDILNTVIEEFPNVNDIQWVGFKSETENSKLASTGYEYIPPTVRYVLDQLNTPPFLNFLEALTGIKGLIPDPYYMGGRYASN